MKLKYVDTHLGIDFENLQFVLVHVILTSLQRTPSFAIVGEEDVRAGVGPVHADKRKRNSRNLSEDGSRQRSDICIWKNTVLCELICNYMNTVRIQIGRSEMRHNRHDRLHCSVAPVFVQIPQPTGSISPCQLKKLQRCLTYR